MKKLIPKAQLGVAIKAIKIVKQPMINRTLKALVAKPKGGSPVNLHMSRIAKNFASYPSTDANGNEYFINGPQVIPYKNDGTFKTLYFDDNPRQTVDDLINTHIESIPSFKYLNDEDQKMIKEILKDKAIEKMSSLSALASRGKIYVGKDVPSNMGYENFLRGLSHEIDHAIHIPTEAPVGFKNLNDYFLRKNGTELAARGSQLKDYFGFTGNEELTPDMLRYAAKHYVENTGLDNDMTKFFNTIDDGALREF